MLVKMLLNADRWLRVSTMGWEPLLYITFRMFSDNDFDVERRRL